MNSGTNKGCFVLKAVSKDDKFKSCIVGALIGDCLGAPFECGFWGQSGIDKEKIFQQLKLNRNGEITSEKRIVEFRYTDDSAMTKSVASSLIKMKAFDNIDMASRFAKEYHKEKFRGYGGEVIKIFRQWKSCEITRDNVLLPSKSQFGGSGSYGNGGAMRISPVGLFASSIEECIKLARETAMLTHSNKHGYNGAILQALAVYNVVNHDNTQKFDVFDFINKLKIEMSKLEENHEAPEDYDLVEEYVEFTFTHQLDVISDLLKLNRTNSYEESVQNAIAKLGHGVSAMDAVPAALYSFLHNVGKGFRETLYFAISLGGDTDTIASMACAIAGAYHGLENVPISWISSSEGSEEFLQYGEQLFEIRKERACK